MLFCRFPVLCVRFVLSTRICLRGLLGGLIESSSAFAWYDPPLYPVVQYMEQYRARLDGRRVAAICLSGNPNYDP